MNKQKTLKEKKQAQKADYYRIFTALFPNRLQSHLNKHYLKLKKTLNVFSSPQITKVKYVSKYMKLFLLMIFVLFFVFFLVFYLNLLDINDQLEKAKEERQKEALFWEDITQTHPDYPDAYYQAAWYYYVLGDKKKSYSLLNKALFLDPDFREAEKLKEKIVEND